MDSKMKMIVGIALVLGVVSVAFLAAPVQAYVDGTGNGDLLQKQERDRVRTHEQNCDGDMLQTQIRDRLRTQDCNCNGDCTQTKYRDGQRVNECAINRNCNCTMSLEQYRNQNRERTEA